MSDQTGTDTINYDDLKADELTLIVTSAATDIASLEGSQESYAVAAIRGLKADAAAAQKELDKRLRKEASDVKGKIGKAAKALVKLIMRDKAIKPQTVSLEIVTAAEQAEKIKAAHAKAAKLEPNGHAISLAIRDLIVGDAAEQAEALISLRALGTEIKGGQTLKIVELPKGTIIDLSEAYTEEYAAQLTAISVGLGIVAKHWRKAPGARGKTFVIVCEDRIKTRATLNKAIREGSGLVKIGKTVATACYVPGKDKPDQEGSIPQLVDSLIKVGDQGFASQHKANGGSRNWLPDFLEPLAKLAGFKITEVVKEDQSPEDDPDATEQARTANVTDHENGLPKPAIADGKVGDTDTVASLLKAEGEAAAEAQIAAEA